MKQYYFLLFFLIMSPASLCFARTRLAQTAYCVLQRLQCVRALHTCAAKKDHQHSQTFYYPSESNVGPMKDRFYIKFLFYAYPQLCNCCTLATHFINTLPNDTQLTASDRAILRNAYAHLAEATYKACGKQVDGERMIEVFEEWCTQKADLEKDEADREIRFKECIPKKFQK